MFRCGPCPLKAIKEGDLNVKFDVPFVFAEVNADIINWEIRPDGQRKRVGDYFACLYSLSIFIITSTSFCLSLKKELLRKLIFLFFLNVS